MKYSQLSLKEIHHLLVKQQIKPSSLAQEVANNLAADLKNNSLITFPKTLFLEEAKRLDQQPIGASFL